MKMSNAKALKLNHPLFIHVNRYDGTCICMIQKKTDSRRKSMIMVKMLCEFNITIQH